MWRMSWMLTQARRSALLWTSLSTSKFRLIAPAESGTQEICLIASFVIMITGMMGLNYWKRGKPCIECKHFTSNIKYCIFRLRPCGRAARQCWAKYFFKTLSLSPQICWPHVSRVSKVHRLPDLRSVYPRSSGNNDNLNHQTVLGEERVGLRLIPWLRFLFGHTGREELDPELSRHLG